MKKTSPLILAPAGNKPAFLTALGAGADAIYCGLKTFSARMVAKNFSIKDLASLAELARKKGTKVYIALNSAIKPDELEPMGKALDQLNRWVRPDALIIQDLSVLQLARQTGFKGEIHLSTLAALSFPEALHLVKQGFHGRVSRVVLPRELNIDEIKAMSEACPKGVDLEVFIHGALCYGVSGRCYWSSYFGGKSGLRGRCVQPCRRLYAQGSQPQRFFSCQDLSLDVLVKVLLSVPQIHAWKIEGRKKGPHYVFYTIKAYQLLRDHGSDPQAKKSALGLLSQALGRPGTHYYFLPQRPQNPVNLKGQTGSGFQMGNVKGGKNGSYLIPREELLSGDVLRIGYEDEAWHGIHKVTKYVPKRGRLYLKFASRKSPPKNAPVFLTDRREKTLGDMIAELESECGQIPEPEIPASNFHPRLPKKYGKKSPLVEVQVSRKFGREKPKDSAGIWLSEAENPRGGLPKSRTIWWWLPPVIWPEKSEKWASLVRMILKKGGRNFVLNAPWQMAFFENLKGLNLWAGPFCNIANPLAIKTLADLGFSGVIVSPELSQEDMLQLPRHSPLPLGIVLSGNWPLCVSRILSDGLKTDRAFFSPKGEGAWVRKYGTDIWVFPNWKVDITDKKDQLRKMGYTQFVHLNEPLPRGTKLKNRPGMWNWNLKLL